MTEITTPTFILSAMAAISGGAWGVWIYFDNPARAAREAARVALAEEKAAWKELVDFLKLTVDVLVAAVILRSETNEKTVKEFQACHKKWRALFSEKKGLLGVKGRERAIEIRKLLTEIDLHYIPFGPPSSPQRITKVPTEHELIALCGRTNEDATFFIH